jgi:hypothetical protein
MVNHVVSNVNPIQNLGKAIKWTSLKRDAFIINHSAAWTSCLSMCTLKTRKCVITFKDIVALRALRHALDSNLRKAYPVPLIIESLFLQRIHTHCTIKSWLINLHRFTKTLKVSFFFQSTNIFGATVKSQVLSTHWGQNKLWSKPFM